MIGKIFASLALAAALVSSMPQDRSPNDQSYLFAMDTDLFLYSPLSLSFTCEGREYGYYADVANNCQVGQQGNPDENLTTPPPKKKD